MLEGAQNSLVRELSSTAIPLLPHCTVVIERKWQQKGLRWIIVNACRTILNLVVTPANFVPRGVSCYSIKSSNKRCAYWSLPSWRPSGQRINLGPFCRWFDFNQSINQSIAFLQLLSINSALAPLTKHKTVNEMRCHRLSAGSTNFFK